MKRSLDKELKSVFGIAILLLVLGTIITVALTNLIQATYKDSEAVYSQVTFLYK